MTEQAMRNGIPLGGPGRIMRHGNGQIEFVGQLLQAEFPQPTPIAIGSTAIRLNQQFLLAGIVVLSTVQPPGTNRRHRKRRGLVRPAHDHIAFIPGHVIDAIRNGFAQRILRKVRFKNVEGRLPPGPPGIFEETDQFFFLRIYADYRAPRLFEFALLPDNVAKLLVAMGIVVRAQAFPIDAQGIASRLE